MIRFTELLLPALALAGSFTVAAQAQDATSPVAITNVRIFDGTRVIPKGTVVVPGGQDRSPSARSVRHPRRRRDRRRHRPDRSCRASSTAIPTPGATRWSARSSSASPPSSTCSPTPTSPARCARSRRRPARPTAPTSTAPAILATAPGGHGTEYGMTIPTLTKPEEAQAWVDARIAEGSDYIKIVIEDGSPYGRKIPTLDRATVAALVAAAHKRGKLAVVHISTEDGRQGGDRGGRGRPRPHLHRPGAGAGLRRPGQAAQGVRHPHPDRGREHDRDSPAARRCRTIPASPPTCGPTRWRTSASRSPHGKLDFQNALAAVRQLAKAGVPILAGTDAPNPGTAHGASIHRELELLVSAGLSPTAALAAATATPARIFGLKDRGRIAPGLRADLVLVKGDPTTDITATRDIQRVWKIGHEMLAPEGAKAAAPPAAKPAAAVPPRARSATSRTAPWRSPSARPGRTRPTSSPAASRSSQKEVVAGGAERQPASRSPSRARSARASPSPGPA